MDRRLKKIYVWSFIIVAGIILLLLQTPMGGRLYYSNDGVRPTYPGVNFQQKIVNSPTSSIPVSSGYAQPDLNVGQNNLLPTSGYSLSGSNIAQSTPRNNSFNTSTSLNSSRTIATKSQENQGAGVTGFIASRTRNSGISETSTTSNLGTLTENVDLNPNSSNQPQKVNGSSGNITDPGGDPDENTMIPVGGSEWYLALLALVYILLKIKFFNKKTI